MNAFWDIVASNCLVAVALAGGVCSTGPLLEEPAALHLLWVFVLLKLVTPPVLTLPIAWPQAHAPAAAEQESNRRSRRPLCVWSVRRRRHVSSPASGTIEGTLEASASAATNAAGPAVTPVRGGGARGALAGRCGVDVGRWHRLFASVKPIGYFAFGDCYAPPNRLHPAC